MKISENVLLAFVAGLPATITSLAALVSSLKNHKVNVANTAKIDAIHQATNGMQEAIVASTAKASHLQGMSDQRIADKQDRADEALQKGKAP